jgi:hypothetical protein
MYRLIGLLSLLLYWSCTGSTPQVQQSTAGTANADDSVVAVAPKLLVTTKETARKDTIRNLFVVAQTVPLLEIK